MIHTFSLAIARKHGIAASVIFNWMLHATDAYRENQKLQRRKRHDFWWIRKSVDSLHQKYPYLTAHQVRTALAKLVEAGLLREEKRVDAGDQTKEYAVVGELRPPHDLLRFNTEYALKFGIVEALILHNLQFWIFQNRSNRLARHEGRQWHYISPSRLALLLPISKKTIHRALANLVDQGVLLKEDRDKNRRRRIPSWAFVDEAQFVKRYAESDESNKAQFIGVESANGEAKTATGCSNFPDGSPKNETGIIGINNNHGPNLVFPEPNSSNEIVAVAPAHAEKTIEAHSQPPVGGVRGGAASLGGSGKCDSAVGATNTQPRTPWRKEDETEFSVRKSFTEAHELLFECSPVSALGRAADVMRQAHEMNVSARLFILALMADHKCSEGAYFPASQLYTQQAQNRLSMIKAVCVQKYACFDATTVLLTFGFNLNDPVIQQFLSCNGTEPDHELFGHLPVFENRQPGQQVQQSWASLYQRFFEEPYVPDQDDYRTAIKLPQSPYHVREMLTLAWRAWEAGDWRADSIALFGIHISSLREKFGDGPRIGPLM